MSLFVLSFSAAGISANKMLSKIASAMHKPNRQTIVPPQKVEAMMSDLPINRVVGFGGKLGTLYVIDLMSACFFIQLSYHIHHMSDSTIVPNLSSPIHLQHGSYSYQRTHNRF